MNTRISPDWPDHPLELAPPIEPNGVNPQEQMVGRPREIRKTQGTLAEIATTDALFEIAGLLAIAYRRYQTVQRTGDNQSQDSGDGELANSGLQSVHGVVS